jgi:hypothetical protein
MKINDLITEGFKFFNAQDFVNTTGLGTVINNDTVTASYNDLDALLPKLRRFGFTNTRQDEDGFSMETESGRIGISWDESKMKLTIVIS